MVNEFFPWHWVSLHALITLLALGIYLMASRTLRQRRHPSAAIAWILSLALIPYLALPLYLLFGNRKVARPPSRLPTAVLETKDSGQPQTSIQILAGTLGLPAPCTYDKFVLHEDGSHARQSLFAVMDGASATLDLCTFSFGRDVLGQEITRHLLQQARIGVRVRLMVDGLGGYLDGHPDFCALTAAGIQVTKFVPPLRFPVPGRTNLRNHRKMVIADGDRLWTGGRNLAAQYFEGDHTFMRKQTPWIDLSFELLGEIARQAQTQFDRDWAFATQQRWVQDARPVEADHTGEPSTVQLVASGPDQPEDTIHTLLVSSCFAAQTRILAVSPYLVPDPTLQMALTLAARRGVDVDLMLPRKSNHKLADMARPAALRELVTSGARVWLFPEMIHAKAVVIDDEFALAGSANLDERSLFLNYEMMVAFYKRSDILKFAQWIEHQRQRAHLYQAIQPGLVRELGEGLVRWLAFQL